MNTCFHCGNLCQEELLFEEKVFCCVGCKTVFEILQESGLSTFYKLNERPGSQIKSSASGKYDYLDQTEIETKLLLFEEGDLAKIRFQLPQIHCSSCLWLLENLYRLNSGVKSTQVNFVAKEAEITFNRAEISLKNLAELLDRIGYPPLISLHEEKTQQERKQKSKIVVQIGIVGFCFGNIMLFSFPEYLGIDASFSSFQNTFKWLNLLLSIPVLVFGAKSYLVSAYKSVRSQSLNIDVPIALGIFALYFQSLYEILTNTGAGYFDSFAGLIFFLLIGKWFQQKTYAAINFERDYKSYFPIATIRKNGDELESITLDKIDVGDTLLIKNNELIPSDAILLSEEARIDYSFVSGESVAIKKQKGDKLFAGGKQIGSAIEITVVKNVENSYLTRLWNNPIFSQTKERKSLSDVISKYFTLSILLISVVAGTVWYQLDPSKTVFVITSILIVACPCAIALSVPFTYGNGLRYLSKRLFFLRSSNVIEALTDINEIVFDKTGTLTQSDQLGVKWEGVALSEKQKSAIATLTFQSSHPLSKRIFSFLKTPISTDSLENYQEFSAKGISADINDCPYKVGNSGWVGVVDESNKTKVHVVENETYLGAFVFGNIYRTDIEQLLTKLRTKYRIHILSGDNDSEKDYLKNLSPDLILNFNQSPQDKLNYISKLQESGAKVLMLGDGLNDSGAIRQANVGIAVVDDAYAFSPASDGILNGSELFKLFDFIQFTRYCKNVVLASYGFALIYNITGLYFALSGQLTPLIAAILMPLSSISSVLLVTLLVNLKSKK